MATLKNLAEIKASKFGSLAKQKELRSYLIERNFNRYTSTSDRFDYECNGIFSQISVRDTKVIASTWCEDQKGEAHYIAYEEFLFYSLMSLDDIKDFIRNSVLEAEKHLIASANEVKVDEVIMFLKDQGFTNFLNENELVFSVKGLSVTAIVKITETTVEVSVRWGTIKINLGESNEANENYESKVLFLSCESSARITQVIEGMVENAIDRAEF